MSVQGCTFVCQCMLRIFVTFSFLKSNIISIIMASAGSQEGRVDVHTACQKDTVFPSPSSETVRCPFNEKARKTGSEPPVGCLHLLRSLSLALSLCISLTLFPPGLLHYSHHVCCSFPPSCLRLLKSSSISKVRLYLFYLACLPFASEQQMAEINKWVKEWSVIGSDAHASPCENRYEQKGKRQRKEEREPCMNIHTVSSRVVKGKPQVPQCGVLNIVT